MIAIRRAIGPMLMVLTESSSLDRGSARGRLAVLLLAGCLACDGEDTEARSIDRLRERSVALACDPMAGFPDNGAVVEDLHAVSDSTFLVLLPLEREVNLYDHRLRRVFSVPFDEAGPLGVKTPRSAAVVDDTLVYVTDLGSQSLRVLSRSRHVGRGRVGTGQVETVRAGTVRDGGTIRIDFSPDRIRAGPTGIVVSAFAMMSRAGDDLVYRLDGTETHPLGLPMEPHEDPRVAALANMLELTVLRDGSVVAAHQVVSSRAGLFRARPNGGFDAVVTTVPVARSERDRLGKVPRDLFEGESFRDVAAPVISGSADHDTGEYLYLTRTGNSLSVGATEKAIVRARPDLSYVASYLLDVDAQHFLYLSRIRTALVVDQDAAWHRCPIP